MFLKIYEQFLLDLLLFSICYSISVSIFIIDSSLTLMISAEFCEQLLSFYTLIECRDIDDENCCENSSSCKGSIYYSGWLYMFVMLWVNNDY